MVAYGLRTPILNTHFSRTNASNSEKCHLIFSIQKNIFAKDSLRNRNQKEYFKTEILENEVQKLQKRNLKTKQTKNVRKKKKLSTTKRKKWRKTTQAKNGQKPVLQYGKMAENEPTKAQQATQKAQKPGKTGQLQRVSWPH